MIDLKAKEMFCVAMLLSGRFTNITALMTYKWLSKFVSQHTGKTLNVARVKISHESFVKSGNCGIFYITGNVTNIVQQNRRHLNVYLIIGRSIL